jgi:hypothetical protein
VISAVWAPGVNGPDQPSTARIRDYWLGGSHHTAADRTLADQILVCAPHLPYGVRIHRAFLRRAVKYLVGTGVRQFLDLGSGAPTAENVHEVAHALAPESRVTYVDIDPVVVAEGRELLADEDNVTYVRADLRRPDDVLGSDEVRALLRRSEPIAVLLVDVLHFVPDCDDPDGLIATYMQALAPGSYVAISHMTEDAGILAAMTMFSRMYGAPLPPLEFRGADRVAKFCNGLELVDPGVVSLPLWKPAEDDPAADRNPEQFRGYAALARKIS